MFTPSPRLLLVLLFLLLLLLFLSEFDRGLTFNGLERREQIRAKSRADMPPSGPVESLDGPTRDANTRVSTVRAVLVLFCYLSFFSFFCFVVWSWR